MSDYILRKADIERVTGLTERTVRAMEARCVFPKRFILNPGGRAVGWQAREVEAWIAERASSRT